MNKLSLRAGEARTPSRLSLQCDGYEGFIEALEGGSLRLCLERAGAPARAAQVVEPLPAATLEVVSDEPLEVRLGASQWSLSGDAFEWRQGELRLCFEAINDDLEGAWSLSLAESDERRYYGLGERTGFLDKKGRRWVNWTTDEPNHGPLTDPLYQAHPFVMVVEGDKACGLYLDVTWRSEFDLAWTTPERSTLSWDGPRLDLYLIPGPGPEDVVTNATRLFGRSPLPPLWALGYHQCRWSYKDAETVRELARNFREQDIPCDVLWLDIDYMENYKCFTASKERFPELPELCRELAEQGFRVVTIIDPGISKDEGYAVYQSGRAHGVFVTHSDGSELIGKVWPDRAVWPDFNSAETRRWWARQVASWARYGVAGIWVDMNEPAVFTIEGQTRKRHFPLDARHGGYSHAELHNLYGSQMAEATRQGLLEARPEERPFVLTRSGFSGVQRQAWVWTGDNSSAWEQLEASIPMILNMGLSGVAFVGADIGGFFATSHGELLARWSWLGAFYPFMRNHCGNLGSRQEPWSFGEPWTSAVRAAIEFRYQLLPHIYSLAVASCESGQPLMRPLFLDDPADAEGWPLHDQFRFGKDLMVAPILRPGRRRRLLYLPDSERWSEFWTGEQAQGWVTGSAEFGRIPLYQRCGSALPMNPERVLATSTARWPVLRWQVAAGPEIRGRLYQDSGNGAADGSWLELRGDCVGSRLRLTISGPELPGQGHEIALLGAPEVIRTNSELRREGPMTIFKLTGRSLDAEFAQAIL